ncbi:MAG: 50S ribosomal protein L3 [Candidatus Aenigmarchaeota archaeon]|nr:50S ribosomal protein L3 [Candidatus Aenigmarchaeota archaeon]MCX8179487.1 50S ribosomal protein L3 [Candidatus Aenigmarchaeota archaeon]
MPKTKRPKRGSLAFYPRKRAKRIYPSIRGGSNSDKLKPLEFSGYKVGMLSLLVTDTRKNSPTKGENIVIPATIIECPPLKVVGFRAYVQDYYGLKPFLDVIDENLKKDRYIARKIKIGETRVQEKLKKIEENKDKIVDVSLIVSTSPHLTGVRKKTPEIFEIDLGGSNVIDKMNYAKELLGKEIKITDVFREGEYLDVVAITKGKGTQGVVKRFGVKIQSRKNMKHHRQIGSLGSQSPGRVRWTVPRQGQMGFFRRTEYNKRLLKIGLDSKEIKAPAGFKNYGIIKSSYILVEGSVPGARKRLVMLRHATRAKTPFLPVDIKEIIIR